jgi:uncharacterized membrane protein
MDSDAILSILFRWLHIFSAAVAIGGVWFARVILPMGLKNLDPQAQQSVIAGTRRGLKMTIHTAILLLLVSGVYNTLRNWGIYKLNPALMHAFWGTHLILGLTVFTISLILLSGKEPKKWARTGMAVNLVLLVIIVALGSSLKWAREKTVAEQKSAPTSPTSPTSPTPAAVSVQD